MKKLICIPTYNEAENIPVIIDAICALNLGFDILVIDDNSPDGTAAVVNELRGNHANLELIRRDGPRLITSTLALSIHE